MFSCCCVCAKKYWLCFSSVRCCDSYIQFWNSLSCRVQKSHSFLPLLGRVFQGLVHMPVSSRYCLTPCLIIQTMPWPSLVFHRPLKKLSTKHFWREAKYFRKNSEIQEVKIPAILFVCNFSF